MELALERMRQELRSPVGVLRPSPAPGHPGFSRLALLCTASFGGYRGRICGPSQQGRDGRESVDSLEWLTHAAPGAQSHPGLSRFCDLPSQVPLALQPGTDSPARHPPDFPGRLSPALQPSILGSAPPATQLVCFLQPSSISGFRS